MTMHPDYQFWKKIYDGCHPLGWYTPWVHIDEDGNPVFSACNPELKRGIRIIQIPDEEEVNPITYWFEKFADEIDELVIDVKKEKSSIVESLMNSWINTGRVPKEFEEHHDYL